MVIFNKWTNIYYAGLSERRCWCFVWVNNVYINIKLTEQQKSITQYIKGLLQKWKFVLSWNETSKGEYLSKYFWCLIIFWVHKFQYFNFMDLMNITNTTLQKYILSRLIVVFTLIMINMYLFVFFFVIFVTIRLV